MDQMKTATTRLRRTFQYPADDDADSTDSLPEALDEEGEYNTLRIDPRASRDNIQALFLQLELP